MFEACAQSLFLEVEVSLQLLPPLGCAALTLIEYVFVNSLPFHLLCPFKHMRVFFCHTRLHSSAPHTHLYSAYFFFPSHLVMWVLLNTCIKCAMLPSL